MNIRLSLDRVLGVPVDASDIIVLRDLARAYAIASPLRISSTAAEYEAAYAGLDDFLDAMQRDPRERDD
jgi:hypothetical protein